MPLTAAGLGTLTVGEIKRLLADYPDDVPVWIEAYKAETDSENRRMSVVAIDAWAVEDAPEKPERVVIWGRLKMIGSDRVEPD